MCWHVHVNFPVHFREGMMSAVQASTASVMSPLLCEWRLFSMLVVAILKKMLKIKRIKWYKAATL